MPAKYDIASQIVNWRITFLSGKSDRKNLSGSDGAAAAGVAPLAEAAAGEVACAAKRSEIRTAGVSGVGGRKM